jgi:IclR family pca regulon transcriptional regulator
MGRVLLSELDDDALTLFLATQTTTPPSQQAITDPVQLGNEIRRIRTQGYALLDQELEDGVRSVAVALRDRRGRALGALNVGTHAARVTLKELRATILPELLRCAESINAQLAKR